MNHAISGSLAVAALGLGLATAACGEDAPGAPLVQEASIALPATPGRIDHFAIDLKRGRLFVAEIGNDTVDVADIAARKVIHRIEALNEPQGVAYAPQSDLLAVSNSGDGTVRLYAGDNFEPRGVVKLDADADNARLDPRNGHIVVGHGSGALAIIAPATATVIADIKLAAHPEAFALAGNRAYVNVPDAGEIDVVDLDAARVIMRWRPDILSSNFPVALDDAGHAAVVFRGQDRFVLFDTVSGKQTASLDTCGDADDVYYDAARRRFLVSCGSSAVDVIATNLSSLRSLGRADTSWGARTSLFVPELDRLFVAERAGLFGSNASIAIFRPIPP